uniref:Uncharacterized protein n=1 Tax=Cacopsylla melanoneura TaxID=428564 RepID=A0A8D8Q2P4_9HEMI
MTFYVICVCYDFLGVMCRKCRNRELCNVLLASYLFSCPSQRLSEPSYFTDRCTLMQLTVSPISPSPLSLFLIAFSLPPSPLYRSPFFLLISLLFLILDAQLYTQNEPDI